MTFGVDYAWQHPSPSALKAAGAKFGGRYLSHDSTKNLTRAEADALAAEDIASVVVWEDTAQRALAGRTAGIADALEASLQAQACGMPSDRPIYFAVDFDATGQTAAVCDYLDGAASVLGKDRTGVYGGLAAVQAALDGGHCDWAWQTYAWSGGRWDSRAQLRQYSNDQTIGGVQLDYDDAVAADYGQWMPGISPTIQEDDMPTGQLADGQGAVTPIALPKGRYKTIGFTCDNGLQGLQPAKLRVAVHHGGWAIVEVDVDSTKGQTVVTFADPANTDGLSVQRLDPGNVHIAWEVS